MTDNEPTDRHASAAEIIASLSNMAAKGVLHTISDADDNEVVAFVRDTDGHVTQSWDLTEFWPSPPRRTGVARFEDVDSFVHYVEDNGGASLYADAAAASIVAVFEDHSDMGPGWADFRAVLTLPPTPEWEAWSRIDGLIEMTGTEFAEHIEDWRHTIAEPATADLIDMARNFRATRKVEFTDEVVDTSGDRSLAYTTETVTAAGGLLDVPEVFTLVLEPHIGAEARPIEARFRYRLAGNRATFGIKLVQPAKFWRDIFEEAVATVEGHLSKVMYGQPVSPRSGLFER